MVVAALLAAGADPGAPDGAGNTPLHYAAGYNALAALPALVREGEREKGLALFPVLRALLEREREAEKKKRKKTHFIFLPPTQKKLQINAKKTALHGQLPLRREE
jgi:ankyrin repeat protein